MRIGIVTAAYDVAPFIGRAIGSVVAQTHHDWRMVVVDDGSRDGTADLVVCHPDPRVRLVRQVHAGVSAARNRGIAASDAEALLFLDADDWLAPDGLAILARTLEDAPWAAAAVGAYVRVRTPNGPTGRSRQPEAGDLLLPLLTRNLFANGGHLLIRREAIDAAGGFCTALQYGEDWEYWIRIALQGEFAATSERRPLCFIRERSGSAYLRLADQAGSFQPCMEAIFGNPDLCRRFSPDQLFRLRRRAEAENAWVIGGS